MKVVDLHSKRPLGHELLNGFEEECRTLAESTYWIPFLTTSQESELETSTFTLNEGNCDSIEFNGIPTITTLKLSFAKILMRNSVDESLKFLCSIWNQKDVGEKRKLWIQSCDLMFHIKYALIDHPERQRLAASFFGQTFYETISKLETLLGLMIAHMARIDTVFSNVPKWKGKPMQFIELISIGIEFLTLHVF